MKILIIEDDPIDFELLKRSITHGAVTEIYHAKSLAEGVAALAEVECDLIFLDLGLPDSFDSFGTFKSLAEAWGDIPIIIVTSLKDEKLAMKLLMNGAQDFIPKSLALNSFILNRSISHVVDKKNWSEEIQFLKEENKQLTYRISHDLQAPLRHISSFAQILLEESKGEESEDFNKALGVILSGTEKMKSMINGLLKLSHLDSDGLAKRDIELDDLVGRIVRGVSDADDKVGIKFNIKELPCIFGDPTQVEEVFNQIISNCLKFRKVDKPAVIEVTSTQSEQYHSIIVSDNGLGIESKFEDKIFEVFHKLHPGSKYPGAGIGLALCKKIMKIHGGSISLSSGEGEGCRFSCHFPKERSKLA